MKTTTEELILKLFNEGIEKKLIQKKVKKTRQYVMFILRPFCLKDFSESTVLLSKFELIK